MVRCIKNNILLMKAMDRICKKMLYEWVDNDNNDVNN